MDEAWKYSVKSKKPVTKDHLVYDPVYMKQE